MAVAMDIGWRSPSFHLGSGKKRGWGEDQQKLLQLMIGQPPIDEATTTMDLLGASSTSSTSSDKEQQPLDLELDMEMPPPSGWEKRLDLKLGKFYYVNLSTGKSTYEHPSKQPCAQSSLSQEFLSLGGQSTAPLRDKESAARRWDLQSELDRIDMKDESQLDLKLNLGGGCLPMPKSLSSIEAVQEALKRSQAATTTTSTSSKQQMPFLSPATSTSSSSSSKMNSSRSTDASESIEKLSCSSAFAAEVVDSKIRQAPAAAAAAVDAKVVLTGCKRCLMYVMLTRADPRCPKCGSSVVLDIPLQQQSPKRPRLELDLCS